nr:hypothetical protein [Paracoccaceae bacterium]
MSKRLNSQIRKKSKKKKPVVIVRRRKKKHDWEPDGIPTADIARESRWEPDGIIGGDVVFADPWEPDGIVGGDVVLANPWEPDGIIGDEISDEALDIADGLYLGGNARLAIELRVDFNGSAIVSGDLFSTAFGGRDYLASFRTAPGTMAAPDDAQPWTVIFEGQGDTVSTGELMLLEGMTENAVTVVLMTHGPLAGLPTMQAMELTAEWRSAALRQLAVEIEMEVGTSRPPTYRFGERDVTFTSVFSDAGIEITEIGMTSQIERPIEKWGIAQLHGLMMDTVSGASLDRPQWRQQLLWLGEPSRAGLLGVMFDSAGVLPRQGTAVFEGEIRRIVPTETDRKIVQTTAHEIGHALNLAHRFEREVGRADTTSIMNYDWRYKGGGKRTEFWRNFAFTFDEDELSFLRHGARHKIVPGGAQFHSATYWADGNGGYSPYLPEVPSDLLSLHLQAPPVAGGHIFEFGQPVLLKVTLTNEMTQPLQFNRRFLDPKGSFLEVLIRKVDGNPHSSVEATHFQPLYERCLDVDADADVIIPPGGTMDDNINITFGASGFAFAEPGMYDIQVVGSTPINVDDMDPSNDRELVFTSNKLRIFVTFPKTRQEEIDVADVLFREDVGTFFALGGSERLDKATSDLKELSERRLHRRKTVSDPVAANIIRCLGIDAGRWTYRYVDGKCKQENGDPAKAAGYLKQLKAGIPADL